MRLHLNQPRNLRRRGNRNIFQKGDAMNLTFPKWVWAVALVVPLLSALPLLAGYASSQSPEKIFMGFDFIDDFHYYGSYIYSYMQSPLDFFIENRATSEEQSGVFFFPVFWVMGLLANIIGIPLAFAFVRFLLAAGVIIALWKVLGHIFTNPLERKTAFLLGAFGTGVGWIFWAAHQIFPRVPVLYSSDLTYSLGYTLFGYLTFPLSIAGELIFLGMVLTLYRQHTKPAVKNILIFSALGALLFFVHPISALTFLPVIGFGLILFVLDHPSRERVDYFKQFGLGFVLMAIPVLLYLFWAFSDNVFTQTFFSYGLWLRSESPFWWLIGYGLILVLSVLGIRHVKIENPVMRAVVWAWLLVVLVLSLNPWKGLRFQHALFLPLIILATFGLRALSEHFQLHFPKVSWLHFSKLSTILLVLMIPSFVLITFTHINDVTNPNFHSGPYLSENEIAAMKFLENESPGIVLSSYKSGNNLIWMTPHRAYLGHWNQTIAREERLASVEKFFSVDTTQFERRALLNDAGISYVFYGPAEREWNDNMTSVLGELGLLIYSNDMVQLYQVSP